MTDKSTEMRSKLVGLIPASALKSSLPPLILAKPAGDVVDAIKTGVRRMDSGSQFKFDKKTGRLYVYLSNADRYMDPVRNMAKANGWQVRVSGYSSLAFESLTAKSTETFAQFGDRVIEAVTKAAKATDSSLNVTSKRETDTRRVRVYVTAARGAQAVFNRIELSVRTLYPNVHIASKGNYSLSLRFDYSSTALKPAEEQIFESSAANVATENQLLAGLKGEDLNKQIEALRGKISPAAFNKIQDILKAERKKQWFWAKTHVFKLITSSGVELDLDNIQKTLTSSLRLSKVNVVRGSQQIVADVTLFPATFPATADSMYAVLQAKGLHDHILIERK